MEYSETLLEDFEARTRQFFEDSTPNTTVELHIVAVPAVPAVPAGEMDLQEGYKIDEYIIHVI